MLKHLFTIFSRRLINHLHTITFSNEEAFFIGFLLSMGGIFSTLSLLVYLFL